VNIDAIRRVNQVREGLVKPSKGEQEAWETIEKIVQQARAEARNAE
jgi:hypothetical protein